MHGHLTVIRASGIVSFNLAWLGWEVSSKSSGIQELYVIMEVFKGK